MSADFATIEAVSKETSKIAQSVAFIRDFVVTTDEDYTFAADMLKLAKANLKRLDEQRTTITQPILQAKRGVDNLFRPALEGLAEMDRLLRQKLGDFTAARENARIAAMVQSAAVFEQGGTPTQLIPEKPEVKGVSVRAVWTFEIINAADVPREFCSPDHALIQASRDWGAYSEHNPPRPIPGVRFILQQAVRVRT